MSNNNIISATSQTPTQAQDWAIFPTYETVEYGEMYETPTGHYIKVTTTQYPSYTNLTIKVSNEEGSVIACTAHFGGVDQEECYEAFYKGYMESSSLQRICEHFDELCTPYDDDEE